MIELYAFIAGFLVGVSPLIIQIAFATQRAQQRRAMAAANQRVLDEFDRQARLRSTEKNRSPFGDRR